MKLRVNHVEDMNIKVWATGEVNDGNFVGEYQLNGMCFGVVFPYPSFEQWESELTKLIKERMLIKNKWREKKFKQLYKNGTSVKEAFRLWILNHSKIKI